MTFLYSCRHDGDQYRITKLTEHLDVESSYLCSTSACTCPACEKRGRCRHMEMLPKFINRGAVGTGWLFDHDRGGWVDNRSEEELAVPKSEGEEVASPEPCGFADRQTFTIPDGYEAVRDAEGRATGEVRPAPAETKPWRRF